MCRAILALPRPASGVVEIFRASQAILARRVPVDGWCGLTLDPSTLLMTGGVHEHGFSPPIIRRLLEIEYGEDDVLAFAALARAPAPAGVLSAALGGDLARSQRYLDVLRPSGYAHELRAALRVARPTGRAQAPGSLMPPSASVTQSYTWGGLILLRRPTAPDFSAEEAALVEAIAPAIGEAVRTALLLAAASARESPGDRAVVVLDAGNHIVSATPEAERWLGDLSEEGPADPAGVPLTVQALANEARRRAQNAEVASLATQTRARGRSGQWLTLSGTSLRDGGQVVVTIEPGRPLEVASLVLAAYGLTAREGELVHHVLQGFDTEQIAELLGIRPYTVQDHLKKIFDKAGVSSRKELVSRLFFAHYLPRIERGQPVGPDGRFQS